MRSPVVALPSCVDVMRRLWHEGVVSAITLGLSGVSVRWVMTWCPDSFFAFSVSEWLRC